MHVLDAAQRERAVEMGRLTGCGGNDDGLARSPGDLRRERDAARHAGVRLAHRAVIAPALKVNRIAGLGRALLREDRVQVQRLALTAVALRRAVRGDVQVAPQHRAAGGQPQHHQQRNDDDPTPRCAQHVQLLVQG